MRSSSFLYLQTGAGTSKLSFGKIGLSFRQKTASPKLIPPREGDNRAHPNELRVVRQDSLGTGYRRRQEGQVSFLRPDHGRARGCA